jgi:hypothetical protein
LLAVVSETENLLAKPGANRPASLDGGQDECDPLNSRIPDRIVSKPANAGKRRGAPERVRVEEAAEPRHRLTRLHEARFETNDDPAAFGSR